MKMLGYGEDGLTLAYLATSLTHFLKFFGEEPRVERCTVYYRISFGRGSHGFGEFDAIIVSEKRIYLCESKWEPRERSERRTIRLGTPQLRRHAVFRKLLLLWRKQNPTTWEEFRAVHSEPIEKFELPGHNSILARTLTEICGSLKDAPPEMRDVVLYFHRCTMPKGDSLTVVGEDTQPRSEFTVLPVRYVIEGGSSHFPLPVQPLTSRPSALFPENSGS